MPSLIKIQYSNNFSSDQFIKVINRPDLTEDQYLSNEYSSSSNLNNTNTSANSPSLSLSSNDDSSNETSSTSPHNMNNICLERKILLTASLQLIDLLEKPESPKIDLSKYDLIRYGFLKKLTNFIPEKGTYSSSKIKYVELLPGLFQYEDVLPDYSVSLKELLSRRHNNSSTRKSIELSNNNFNCRQIEKFPCAFQIVSFDKNTKTWLASCPEECLEWVNAIKSMMLDNINEHFVFSNSFVNSNSNNVSSSNSSTASNVSNHSSLATHPSILSPGTTSSTTKTPIRNKKYSTWLSLSGSASIYKSEMILFLKCQKLFNSLLNNKERLQLVLNNFINQKLFLTIPVYFVRKNFDLNDNLTRFGTNLKSNQLWKDLNRDVLLINNERVSGELGAEAMVATLVRVIAQKLDVINNYRKAYELSSNNTMTYLPNNILESDIIKCARDLLVMCNRTQSGGDTYFCIDSLIMGNTQKSLDSLFMLNPYDQQSEPLTFFIDIVQIDNSNKLLANNYICDKRFMSNELNTSICISENDLKSPSNLTKNLTNQASSISSSSHTFLTPPKNTAKNFTISANMLNPQSNLPYEMTNTDDTSLISTVCPDYLTTNKNSESTKKVENGTEPSSNNNSGNRPNSFQINYRSQIDINFDNEDDLDFENDLTTELLTYNKINNKCNNSKDDSSILSDITYDTKHPGNSLHHRTIQLNVEEDEDIEERPSLVYNNFHQELLEEDEEEEIDGEECDKYNEVKRNKSIFKKLSKPFKKKKTDVPSILSPPSSKLSSIRSPSPSIGITDIYRTSSSTNFSTKEKEDILSFKNKSKMTPSSSTPTPSSSTMTSPSPASPTVPINPSTLCVRIRFASSSKFKITSSDPVGDESQDTWAILRGDFSQTFYLMKNKSNGFAMTDRIVSINFE